MTFYYLSKEMDLALNNILGKACSYNKDFSREDIAITWINYKSENKSVFKGFGTGINNKKMIYPASIVKWFMVLLHIIGLKEEVYYYRMKLLML